MKSKSAAKASLHSMTGFGEHGATVEGIACNCRIRSVNHRYLELKLWLPRSDLYAFETKIREAVQAKLQRGAVELHFALGLPQSAGLKTRSTGSASATAPSVNTKVLKEYVKAIQTLDKSLGTLKKKTTLDLAELLRLPGVLETTPNNSQTTALERDSNALSDLLSTPAGQEKVLAKIILPAIDQMEQSRAREGLSLSKHLNRILDEMSQHLSGIEKIEPRERDQMVVTLENRVLTALKFFSKEGMGGEQTDFVKKIREEAAFWLERRDIEEERVRLSSHIAEVKDLLKRGGISSGKRLEFLQQEMFREINTLGNKAQSMKISQHSIEIKTLLDRFKEQVANVE